MYNTTRVDKTLGRLVIYQIPKNRFPGIQASYTVENGIVSIVCTSDKKYTDNRQQSPYKDVAGHKVGSATAMMKKPAVMSLDGPIAIRGRLNTEVATEEMPDGMTVSAPIESRFSDNPFKSASRVSSAYGGKLSITWEASDVSVLYPGMPCTYYYVKDDKMKKTNGTLLHAHSYTQLNAHSLTATGHLTSASLSMYVDLAGNAL